MLPHRPARARRQAPGRLQGEPSPLTRAAFPLPRLSVENDGHPRIAGRKAWRDAYRYAPDGSPIGWTRYDGQSATDFTPDGLAVLEKDSAGRHNPKLCPFHEAAGHCRSRL